jgi:hypothetical protein
MSSPDFYREHGSCPKKAEESDLYRLPDFIKMEYIRLETDDKPSCIFVRKDKLKEISVEQWKKAAEWRYNLPNEKN